MGYCGRRCNSNIYSVFFNCIIVFIIVSEKAILAIMAIFVIYFDDYSCIKRQIQMIFKKKPTTKKKDKLIKRDETLELYKTMSFLFLVIRFITPFAGWFTMGVAILLPVLSILHYYRYSNKILFSSGEKGQLSTMAKIIVIPGMIMFFIKTGNQTYPIHFWLLWGVVFLTFVIPFFLFTKEYKNNGIVALAFCAGLLLFSFSAICTINQEYDFSVPVKYSVRVIDQHASNGKVHSYYLVVKGSLNGDEDTFRVSSSKYEEIKIGDIVTIVKKEGLLKFEWCYLDLE